MPQATPWWQTHALPQKPVAILPEKDRPVLMAAMALQCDAMRW
jgi:hypothetical protein